MIKAKVSTDYKDIEHIFAGGAIQKEIIKVWSIEANDYVFEAWKVLEMEGPLPLTFNAKGEPLIDYRIYGNTEQTGTPTPENPIMPIGCGERTENLFDYTAKDANKGYVPNNILRSNGSETYSYGYYISEYVDISNLTSDEITTNIGASLSSPSLCFYDANKGYISGVNYGGLRVKVYTIPANAKYCRFTVVNQSEYSSTTMLVEGSTAPESYIPYGYKLPILSNSTVTNIYLGQVESTRKIKKLVLTGTENWGYTALNHIAYMSMPNSFLGEGVSVVSTHYIAVSNKELYIQLSDKQCCLHVNLNHLWIRDNDYSTVTDFKAYLAAQYAASTPVTVWYVLAEHETAVVNEPLMKIGEYVDTVDSAQANMQIPTIAGTNVIDYDGGEKRFITSDGYELVDKNQNAFLLSGSTLSPEKMYVKYKGR